MILPVHWRELNLIDRSGSITNWRYLMNRLVYGAFALTLLVSTGLVAGEGLKSGPQVKTGKIRAFNPLHCSGPGEGGRACLV